ncbi:MAG: TlpA family protein disulfide reductase [Deltaproteobacteria bacterium]|nr:TlpA family protein disulfide reductase [Deltaproteobacteria bacterium]
MLLVFLLACIPELTSKKVGACADGLPENEWPVGEPPVDLLGEGYEVGEVVGDACVPDQNGDDVALWQFYGRVWVLDVSTMWCAPCQVLAHGLQEIADGYADEEFSYVTVLAEDLGSDVPDNAELNEWAGNFGIREPVLADAVGFTSGIVRNGTYPAVLIIGRDMVVHQRLDVPSDEAIIEAVDSAL